MSDGPSDFFGDVSPSEKVDLIMRQLQLTPGQFFLGGSAALALRNIRHVGDIDLGVTTRYWFEMLYSGNWRLWTTEPDDMRRRCDPPYLIRDVGGVEVHAFYAWRRRGADETEFNDFNRVFFEGTEEVNGWPCIKLPILTRQKIDAVQWWPPREKDLRDISDIAQYLIDAGQAIEELR